MFMSTADNAVWSSCAGDTCYVQGCTNWGVPPVDMDAAMSSVSFLLVHFVIGAGRARQ